MTNSADYPDLPFVQARGDGGPRSATRVIVIHATDNTAPAKNEASYATRREDETSAHFYIDAVETIQALPIGNVAYGCLWHGNQISVQYELCGRSSQIPDAVIVRAAKQVARDCARYGIPVRRVSAAQVAAGEKGICGHDTITQAFPMDGGDHTDPGPGFPWDRFIKLVAEASKPPVPPAPAPSPAPAKRTVTLVQYPGKPSSMWHVAEIAFGPGKGARWPEIWNMPDNASLRQRAGGDAQRVQPGWVVTIP